MNGYPHILFAGLVVLMSSFASAKERPFAEAKGDFAAVGSLTCSSVACHGAQQLELGRPRVREAYVSWLEFDPHARTRELLYSREYKAILDRLENGGQTHAELASRCAQCHDPGAASGATVGAGVGCESCHGNAEKWLTRHYEFGVTPPELLSLGKIDTKSLPQRAAACAKCHVGSTSQDMNHDMIAAGHPPLRFELAAYHDLLKFKHWNDGPARLEKKDYQVQLWAAGQTASAQARLDLLACRTVADQEDASKATPWPELAEFNCFACHQKIRSGPELGSTASSLPGWNRWNLAFAGMLRTNRADELQSSVLTELYRAPFLAKRSDIQEVSDRLSHQLRADNSGEPLDAVALLNKLKFILDKEHDQATDWETRSQQYLALVAAERSYRDRLDIELHRGTIRGNIYQGRIAIESVLLKELREIRKVLAFENDPRKAVLIDEPLEFRQNQGELRERLLRIAETLHDRIQAQP